MCSSSTPTVVQVCGDLSSSLLLELIVTCLQLTTTEAYKISHFVYILCAACLLEFKRKGHKKKQYYIDHKEKFLLQARKNYAANSGLKKCASKEYCETHKEQKVAYDSK